MELSDMLTGVRFHSDPKQLSGTLDHDLIIFYHVPDSEFVGDTPELVEELAKVAVFCMCDLPLEPDPVCRTPFLLRRPTDILETSGLRQPLWRVPPMSLPLPTLSPIGSASKGRQHSSTVSALVLRCLASPRRSRSSDPGRGHTIGSSWVASVIPDRTSAI